MVSADGSWIAYKWEVRRIVATGPEWAALGQTVSLCWAAAERPAETKMILVGDWGIGNKDRSLYDETFFEFSPGGNRLAVASPFGLMVLELETAQSRTSPAAEGYLTSLCWLDENSVAYVEHRPRGDHGTERAVWSQRVDARPDERHLIYRDVTELVGTATTGRHEFWSHDGRYLLITSEDKGNNEEVLLVSTSDGEVTTLQESSLCECASWDRTASQVFWLSRARAGNLLSAYLYDVSTRERWDLTREWREAFGAARGYSTHLEPLWTPDNQFVVGNAMDVGGFLIQPKPWHQRLLGKALAQSGSYPPDVRGQQTSGVLVAQLYPNEAVIDYSGNIIQRLGGGGYSGWTVLPDATEAISIHSDNSVVVQALP